MTLANVSLQGVSKLPSQLRDFTCTPKGSAFGAEGNPLQQPTSIGLEPMEKAEGFSHLYIIVSCLCRAQTPDSVGWLPSTGRDPLGGSNGEAGEKPDADADA